MNILYIILHYLLLLFKMNQNIYDIYWIWMQNLYYLFLFEDSFFISRHPFSSIYHKIFLKRIQLRAYRIVLAYLKNSLFFVLDIIVSWGYSLLVHPSVLKASKQWSSPNPGKSFMVIKFLESLLSISFLLLTLK